MDLAIAFQKEKRISLDQAMVEKGLINEKDLMVLLVKELHIPFINLSKYKINKDLKDVIPERIARQYHIIPISKLQTTITIALSDPLNIFAMDDVKNITGCDIDVVMGTDSDILRAIDAFYGVRNAHSVQDVSKDIDVADFEIISEQAGFQQEDVKIDEGEQAPIIRMVNLVIQEALKQRASDIHLEPQNDNLRVRYRVDGILQDFLNIPKVNQNAVTIRIKIMSRLDITTTRVRKTAVLNEGRKPGSGFPRVALPTTFGQKVVRVLDRKSLSIGLAGLGFLGFSRKY